MAILKVWNGSSWVPGLMKVYSSGSWGGVGKIRIGSSWVTFGTAYNLLGGSFSNSGGGAAVVASYSLDGVDEEDNGTQFNAWLSGADPADYEARMVMTSGSFGGSPTGSLNWTSLASELNWSVTDTTNNGVSVGGEGELTIRLASDLSHVATATVTLTASKTS